MPEEVRAATGAYRAEMDILGGFLADCCVVQDRAQRPRKPSTRRIHPGAKRPENVENRKSRSEKRSLKAVLSPIGSENRRFEPGLASVYAMKTTLMTGPKHLQKPRTRRTRL